jgi:hypothetical protein
VTRFCTYFPNSGNFGNKHFRKWAITYGNIDAQENTDDVTGAKVNYLSVPNALNGTVLTSALTLWVFLNPYGTYDADGAKTADATCDQFDNTCRY